MRNISISGLAGVALHLAIVGYSVALMLSAAQQGLAAGATVDWTRYWMLFLALDFPVSLGVMPVVWLAPPATGGPLADYPNFWWPLAYHGCIGTAWWYIVGRTIGHKVRASRTGGTDATGR
jgi:hypothetical protein